MNFFIPLHTLNIAKTAQSCVEEYRTSCLSLPVNLDSVSAIWPQYPQSDVDCECPVFESDDQHNFRDCYCFRERLTKFDVELNSHKLCWKNLTRDTNDTKIILLKGMYLNSLSFDVTYAKNIFNQTRISVEGICFNLIYII